MRLTPNQRMAQFLARSSSPVMPLANFGIVLWEKLKNKHPELPRILTLIEQRIIWEKLLEEKFLRDDNNKENTKDSIIDSNNERILQKDSFIALLQDAYKMIKEGQIPLTELQQCALIQHLNEDQTVFLSLLLAYEEFCQEKLCIDPLQLLTSLSDLLSPVSQTDERLLKKCSLSTESLLPQKIECLGFLELTNQELQFLDCLKQNGVFIQYSSLLNQRVLKVPDLKVDNSEHNNIVVMQNSEREELLAAAYFVKGELNKNPHGRFAIVIPDLTSRRVEVSTLFQELLPEQFNISAPIPLSEYPMIKNALEAFNLMKNLIALDDLSVFLRSPFFQGGLKHMNERHTLDLKLWEMGQESMTIIDLLQYIEKGFGTLQKTQDLSESDVLLQQIFQQLRVLQGHFKQKQTVVKWHALLKNVLEILGWPLERTLTELEQQLQGQWEEVLTKYLGLEHVLFEHNFEHCLHVLTYLVSEHLFLPKSSFAPVQVLGLLEAVGLPFDALWIVGCHQNAFPKPPLANPLIPFVLQKKYNLPRSSANRELQIAKLIIKSLQEAAPQVIFSFPQYINDQPAKVSPLLADLPLKTINELGISLPASYFRQQLCAAREHLPNEKNSSLANISGDKNRSDHLLVNPCPQKMTDESGPALLDEHIKGGSYTLKLQSNCPFRAFAEIRLKATAFPKLKLGLNHAERGDIVHQILLDFWQPLKTQAALLALNDEIILDKLGKSINKIFVQWQNKHRSLMPNYLGLEKKRMLQLLKRFIDLEKIRPPFEISSQEILEEVKVGKLIFKLRLDRIDKLSNGEEILIDYKTGRISISSWFGERLQDPQLPLYSVTRKKTPKALVFALIRVDELKYLGLADESLANEALFSSVKTIGYAKRYGAERSFADQNQVWQRQIETLAHEFSLGIAKVAPKDGEATCRDCHLEHFCRVKF